MMYIIISFLETPSYPSQFLFTSIRIFVAFSFISSFAYNQFSSHSL